MFGGVAGCVAGGVAGCVAGGVACCVVLLDVWQNVWCD